MEINSCKRWRFEKLVPAQGTPGDRETLTPKHTIRSRPLRRSGHRSLANLPLPGPDLAIGQAASTPGRPVVGHPLSGAGVKTMFDSSDLRALGVLDELLGGQILSRRTVQATVIIPTQLLIARACRSSVIGHRR